MRRATITTLLATAAVTLGLAAPAAAAERAGSGRSFELGGKRCELIPVPTTRPTAGAFGAGACRGVRPGALVETQVGFCTMNFLFRGGGHRYIGTAGHCVLEGRGERRYDRGGPVAKDSRGRRIGRFRYAVLRGEKDFALIRLNRRGRALARPGVCHFGGPTGIDATRPKAALALEHYGQGIVTGSTTPARTFIAKGMRDRQHVFAQGTVLPGDSGGPVNRRATGRAVGLVVTTGFHLDAGGPGTVGITRLPPQRARAAEVLDERLRIVPAPRR